MNRIKIIIADDSRLMREVIGGMIRDEEDIHIVGQAGDGREALKLCQEVDVDILILDVIMPEMDGIEVLKALRNLHSPVRTIVFSSKTQRFAPITVEALALGAAGYIPKPQGIREQANYDATKSELLGLIRGLNKKRTLKASSKLESTNLVKEDSSPKVPKTTEPSTPAFPEFIVLATSTGGPNALSLLLKKIPRSLEVPVAIVQHMPKVFLPQLAERLSREGVHQIDMIEDGLRPEKGKWYLAPGDIHSRLAFDKRRNIVFQTFDGPKEVFCKPSANPLFRSAAMIYRKKCHGIVMTGMGQDGLDGSKMIKSLGGTVIIQSKNDSVVWGMPGSVYDEGLADYILEIDKIAEYLTETIGEPAH